MRTYAQTILRRGVNDSAQVATVARHLSAFPHLAAAYAAGSVHTANLRAILEHREACGPDVLQAHEPALLDLVGGRRRQARRLKSLPDSVWRAAVTRVQTGRQWPAEVCRGAEPP